MHVRSLLAAALAALLAVPAAAAAAPKGAAQKPPAAPASQGLAVGGFVGWEMGDLDGFQLRLDGEMPFQKLAPQVDLSFVGAVSFSRLTLSESAFGFDVDSTANLLKVVPAARFTLPLNPQLGLFGDAGIGLYYSSLSIDTNVPFSADVDDSSVGLMLRLAAGGFFQVNPKVRLSGELVLDPMFGDYDDTTFAIMVGAMLRL